MQEAGTLTVITPAQKKLRPDSIGQPCLFAEVKVVDEEGNVCAANERGKIIARSPTGTSSYFQNPDKSAETFRGGWLHTGDLGHFDEEGFLYIAGRDKDMLISGGQNIFSIEIEEVLLEIEAVIDCAVIGLPDEVWGEKVTAVIQCQPDSVAEQSIIEYCKGKLAGFKVPKAIIFTQELIPRTPTGKVTKFVLVEKYS
jgi:fatty-acyl-CoA synthase